MKKKYLILIGLLVALAAVLSGCAAGLTASSWPGVTADAKNAYIAGGPYVYAVSLQTGAQVWRYPDKASANPFDATPALTPDGQQLIVGGFDKKLYSLNPQTGQSTWQFTGARDRWIGGVLVSDNMIFAPNADYSVYTLDLQGKLVWSFAADQSIWGTPVSDGTNIYFGTLGRKVYAVNIKSGKQAWVQNVDGAVLGSPVLAVLGANKTLYLGTYNGTIYAINPGNGSGKSFASTARTPADWIWSGPTLDATSIYFGDGNGTLYPRPISGSDQPWEKSLNGSILGTPLVNGKTIIVGTEAGNLYFVDSSGENLRPISISGKIYATPVAAGNLILVAPLGGDATLVALDQTGAVKWSFIPPK